MKILEDYSLRQHNTLGLDVRADYFLRLDSIDDLLLLRHHPEFFGRPICILGGGSNVVFAKDFPGLVLHINLLGKEIVAETNTVVELKVGAGENWHQTVLYTVEQGWWGIENLSLIPGTVGASPIQNIGAYGVELCGVFKELNAVELSSGKSFVFDKDDCEFAYRDSIFKSKYPAKYLITSVTLRLNKQCQPQLTYTELEQAIVSDKSTPLSPKKVSDAVCCIRRRKLPDPAEIGNVGSFFKNPVVDAHHFNNLHSAYPGMPYFKLDNTAADSQYKLAAGWLIDQCGWKGARLGNAGVYEKQALVLVNNGGAKPEEILQLAEDIKQSVKNKFSVDLVREPVLVA